MIILLTGVAGFIGYHVAQHLLSVGATVIGVDNLTPYYDPALKNARLERLHHDRFTFYNADIGNKVAVSAILFEQPHVTHVIHLAAQAGVRYSMENPVAYVHSNVLGHVIMLEAARTLKDLRHFVYASSSSVYGLGTDFPLEESQLVDKPTSVYAATKRADELLSYAFAHLYGLPQTGLRFFTVYGPWGRPDMAYWSFAEDILAGRAITLYDGGTLRRDFTYISDIVSGVVGVIDCPPDPKDSPRVLNIGNNQAERVSHLVELLEKGLNRRAIIRVVPRPASDVAATWASVDRIAALTGYTPTTPLAEGIPRFVEWLKTYRGLT